MDIKDLPSELQAGSKEAPAGSSFSGLLKWGDLDPVKFYADIVTLDTEVGYPRVMGMSVKNVPPPIGERIVINVYANKSGDYILGPEGSEHQSGVYVVGILAHGDDYGSVHDQDGKISVTLNPNGSFSAKFQFTFTLNGQRGEFLNGTVNIPASE
ncbi:MULTISPECIES: hypothetical protein [unclassified Pseudomonas]|uniref:hypothetical protein n=1 Tax=unclassified Pseudomonas TaxID=196821 RepID=UPI0011BE2D1F|nr:MULTISPECIES: hypothetical protein [unclassified Pseudomonas]